jgi:hypothetical protein
MFIDHLDTVGLIVGTAGSFLWAQNGKYMRYCVVFWVVSSLLWLAFAIDRSMPTLFLSNCINLAIHAYSARAWFAARTKSLASCSARLANVDLGQSMARLLPLASYRALLPTWRRRRP